MPKYYRVPIIVEATQWFKLGDHHRVEFRPHPEHYISCEKCSNDQESHGIVKIEGQWPVVVCPGDWIITDTNSDVRIMSDIQFKEECRCF